jgi:lambda family phage portal protein
MQFANITRDFTANPASQSIVLNQKAPTERKFEAAKKTNITHSFDGAWGTPDAEIRSDAALIRARSRWLAQNNAYFIGFLNALLNNVLGPTGIHFQSKIMNSPAFGDNAESADDQANNMLEMAYAKATNRQNYSVTRRLTKRMADRIKLRAIAVDGEVFVRTFKGFNNGTGIARQIIRAEMCDMAYNVPRLANGNEVRMGVEIDGFGARVAYHFLKYTPNDYQRPLGDARQRERVDASEIRHLFVQLEPGQTRGIPWAHASMLQLRMLGLFEEAALVNAKIGASRNVYYTTEFPGGFTPDDVTDYVKTDKGKIPDVLNEGEAVQLPVGVKAAMLDTRYPDAAINPFIMAMLRGSACGLGTSYMTLSNDLSQANFSSLRAGLNEERSQWASVQQFFIEEDCQPDYEEWLNYALGLQKVKLPATRFDKFNQPEFTGRRWPSVNPLQDAAANKINVDNLFESRSAIIRQGGRDPGEVFAEIGQDRDLTDGLKLYPAGDPNLAAEVQKAAIDEPAAAVPAAKP